MNTKAMKTKTTRLEKIIRLAAAAKKAGDEMDAEGIRESNVSALFYQERVTFSEHKRAQRAWNRSIDRHVAACAALIEEVGRFDKHLFPNGRVHLKARRVSTMNTETKKTITPASKSFIESAMAKLGQAPKGGKGA
jgi:hypothetical protein